jgi:hypothetical protein
MSSRRPVRLCTLFVAIVLAALPAFSETREPSIQFAPSVVTVTGAPGAAVAWISVSRGRDRGVSRLRSARGSAVANQLGVVTTSADAESGRAIWIAANVAAGDVTIATPAGYAPSAVPVRIDASAGATSVGVAAPVMKLLYVRPGEGAWTFSGKDGVPLEGGYALMDGDGTQNALITVPLEALVPLDGAPQPPSSVRAGDVICVIDSRWMKVGKVVVSQ